MNKKFYLYYFLFGIILTTCAIRPVEEELDRTISTQTPIRRSSIDITSTVLVPIFTPTMENSQEATKSILTLTPAPDIEHNGLQLLNNFEIRTSHFALSANEKVLAVSDFPNSAKVYDISSGVLLHELSIPLSSAGLVGKVTFFENDTLLATQFVTDVVTSTLGSVYIWDWTQEKIMARFNVNVTQGYYYPCYANDFEISKNNDLLAILDCEGIEIWDIKTKIMLGNIDQIDVADISFSNSGKLLAIAQMIKGKPPVQIWELNDCSPACNLKFELFPPSSDQDDLIEAKKILFYGDILAAIINGKLRLWNFEDEKEITWPQSVLTSSLIQIAFSSKGLLATLTEEGLLVLFDPYSGMKLGEQQMPGATQMAFSSDGYNIIVGGDLNLQIWEIQQK